MELKGDNVWGMDFEQYQKQVLSPVLLKKAIPDDIREPIRVINQLLLHSYFEYAFIELAVTDAAVTLEKAMKVRYKELFGKVPKMRFVELIEWFYDNHYFETYNKDFVHQLRNIRNGKVHDEKRTTGGMVFIEKVYNAFDLINDLYEDPILRKERKEELSDLKEAINTFMKDGTILSCNDQRLIVFNAYPVFINNKSKDKVLCLSVCPIFDLAPFRQKHYYNPRHIQLYVKNWHFDEHEFNATDALTGKDVVFSQYMSGENQKRFVPWVRELYGFEDWSMILFLAVERVSESFRLEWKAFHQYDESA